MKLPLSHNNDYGEEYFIFVNGQFTTQGGTHQQAFSEAYVKTIRDFFKKDYDAADIRQEVLCAAISVRVQEPVFESQTKTKLGFANMFMMAARAVKNFIQDFLSKELDNYLHQNPSNCRCD